MLFQKMQLIQSPKLLLPHSLLTTTLSIFLLILPVATSLSFKLSSITLNDSPSINCTGDASLSIQGIQLTPNPDEYSNKSSLRNKTGRATYFQTLHLWDKTSGDLTDFTTKFSFVIEGNNYGEGLAFFLAPNGSDIPPGSAGGGLGLVDVDQNRTAVPGAHAFVAVEFDAYRNEWEVGLPVNHVGINLNSRDSVKTVTWESGITYGKTNDAQISYDSRTHNLSVVFSGFVDDAEISQNLNYLVDLREYLPEWVTFGFSASTGESYEKNSVRSWEFSGSLDEPVKGVGKERRERGLTEVGKERGQRGLIVGLSVGLGVLMLCGVCLVWICLWGNDKLGVKRDENVRDRSMDDEFRKGTGPRKFSYEELALATDGFSEKNKLGEGGFGGVYRGFVRELNSFIAVKRVSSGSKQGLKEYASEVKIISQLRHRNLVQLTGWCHEKNELLLVYEFMPNGSLDFHLFKGRSFLTWEVRYKIAQGLASALYYLHEQWEQCVVHRDVKSSNVMLDSNYNAKLGDFGLAKIVDHGKGVQTTAAVGTMGYIAPEYLASGKPTKESDVYSFGVVALEIACGRRAIELWVEQNRIKIVDWVWELYGMGRLVEGADPRLGADFDDQQIERLMIVGLWCAHPDYHFRPSMRQAMLALNFEAPLPTLPTTMPLNPFSSSTSSSYYGTSSTISTQVESSNYGNNSNSSKLPASSAANSSVSLA